MSDYPFLFGLKEETEARIEELMREPVRKLAEEIEERHVNIWLNKAWRNGWYAGLKEKAGI
jgi:hypothetical protein